MDYLKEFFYVPKRTQDQYLRDVLKLIDSINPPLLFTCGCISLRTGLPLGKSQFGDFYSLRPVLYLPFNRWLCGPRYIENFSRSFRNENTMYMEVVSGCCRFFNDVDLTEDLWKSFDNDTYNIVCTGEFLLEIRTITIYTNSFTEIMEVTRITEETR